MSKKEERPKQQHKYVPNECHGKGNAPLACVVHHKEVFLGLPLFQLIGTLQQDGRQLVLPPTLLLQANRDPRCFFCAGGAGQQDALRVGGFGFLLLPLLIRDPQFLGHQPGGLLEAAAGKGLKGIAPRLEGWWH